MSSNREPWVKVKIGMADSEKLAALPDDSARWGYVRLLLKVKTLRRMGVLVSRTHVADLVGRHAEYLDEWIERGLVHVAPALCEDCAGRHAPDQLKPGELVVHDYLLEQRDPTNADRQSTWRKLQTALQALEAAGIAIPVTDSLTATVTLHAVTPDAILPEPLTPAVTPASVTPAPPERDPEPVTPTVTLDSRVRGMTVTVTPPEKNGLEEEVVGVDVPSASAPDVDDGKPLTRPSSLLPRTKASTVGAAIAVPSRLEALTPKWRTPCSNYVAHQSQHRIVDGQAICDACEAIAAAAAPKPNGVGQVQELGL